MSTSFAITDNFSVSLTSSVKVAKSIAFSKDHGSYGIAHLALAMFQEDTGLKEILSSMNKDLGYLIEWFEMQSEAYTSKPGNDKQEISPDGEVERIFEESERSKIKLGTDYIDALCVFTAIIRKGVVFSDKQIELLGVSEEEILKYYDAPLRMPLAGSSDSSEGGSSGLEAFPFCKLLHELDGENQYPSIIGRDKQVRSIIENIGRRESFGVMLVGDPGVGKSSIIKSLVYTLATSQQNIVEEQPVIGIQAALLLASISNPVEIPNKLNNVFEKLAKIENAIVVLDGLQILLDASDRASNSLLYIISSALDNKHFNLIVTVTSDAFRKFIDKSVLIDKLEQIPISELNDDFVYKCLEVKRKSLKIHYKLDIEDSALEASIHHAKRYFKERKLPFAAIDLLDRTLAEVELINKDAFYQFDQLKAEFARLISAEETTLRDYKILFHTFYDRINSVLLMQMDLSFDFAKEQNKDAFVSQFQELMDQLEKLLEKKITVITELEVSAIVANATGIPLGKISADEKKKLLDIENKLRERVKGQDHALSVLSDAIIESRSGLSNMKQPIGSFFFLGPTGTGKTELAKSLAELLFDDENAMIRFDMSEFKEEHSAALLYGAPPGYVGYEEGGMLVNKIRKQPYAVVLFDEIEKAHQSVYDVFLQIMDEGKIHDKLGKEGDFSNSIVIFTSNIGSNWIAEQFSKNSIPTSNQLIEIMSGNFRPEFLGRINEVIPFAPINEEIAKLIFNLHLGSLQGQLEQEKGIVLQLSDEATYFLSEKGFSSTYGARPIAGIIRNYLKRPIARMIVAESVSYGDSILLSMKELNLIWEKTN